MAKKKPAKNPDDDLPEVYVPQSLRQGEPVKRVTTDYVCAYETVWKGDNPRTEYAVWSGPYLDVHICMDKHPAKDSILNAARTANAVIVRRNMDGSDEVLYRWRATMTDPGKWVREKK